MNDFTNQRWKKQLLAFSMAFLTIPVLYGCGTNENTEQSQTMTDTTQDLEQTEVDPESDTVASEEQTQPDSSQDTESVQEDEQTVGTYTITMKDTSDTETSEDGKVDYISYTYSYPEVTNPENTAAADAINAYFAQAKETAQNGDSEYLEWAKEDYQMRLESEQTDGITMNWYPYSIETTYETAKVDDQFVSFIGQSYAYTGGAHGNHAIFGVTFDSKTGQRLLFSDLTDDEDAARAFVEEQILTQANAIQENATQAEDSKAADSEESENGEIGQILFEEYADYIPDVLTDDSWYFTEDGMVIVAGEYLLASYAAGPIYFSIPYEECTFLKEQYRQ